jgi:hypothetical protein
VTTPDTSTVTGQAVGYTGTVTALAPGAGVPTGSAVLRVDGTATGSPEPLSGGVAVFPPVTSLTAGPHTITVSYDGDDNFAASSGSTPQTVTPAQTTTLVTTSPSPSAEDQTVTITASVTAQAPGSGAPTGTVTFTSDGDPIGAATLAPTGGGTTATLAISTLPPGSHSIVATYAGDANYVTSTSDPVSQTVTTGVATAETVTTLDSSVNPSTYGQLISFSAAVSAVDPAAGTPSGAVQFSVDGVNVGGPVTLDAEGRAQSAVLASPDPGDHTVIAAFLPDTGFSASGAQLTQQIADAAVQTTLVSSDAHTTYGQGVSFTATVASTQLGTGNPTGLVQFRIDNQPLGGAVPLTDGVASSPSISTLSPGTHTVTAVYSGDVDFLADLVSITQTVDKIATTTALTATPASTSYGHPVTLSAVVTPASSGFGAPAGTVTFTDGSTTLGTVPVAASGSTGTAALTVPSFGGGSHSIKAAYSGAAIFAGSTSAATAVTITRTATTLSAAAALVKLSPLGLPLGVLKATLTSPNGPVAGQPIVFTIGATTVCTTYTDASGQATCNALAHLVQLVLYLGYKAAYAGNSDYLPSNATGGIIK